MDSPMPMVSSSIGVVNSLLKKLTKPDGSYSEFKDLTQDLESIRKDLLKFAARGVKSMQVKQWMKQVREVVYDMEDWIDLCIRPSKPDKPEPATTFGWSDDIAEQIEEFKAQIQEAQDRCTRYGLLDKLPTSDADLADLGVPRKVTINPNLLWGEKTGLVALKGPENELVNHLMDEEQKLKVVSILGMGGLGKTTLAKQVYGKLKWRFECRAFVYGGQNPSIKTTLINILYQVMSLPRYKVESWGEKNVISKLWEFLSKNRYFIVIDDIWSIWAWSAISCTLPDNNLGSRILMTTRIDAVAKSCCVHPTDFVHPMKALSECDSKRLLLNRISVLEKDWPFDSKICDNMLKLCGGKPLAIIVTAGLLAAKCAELGQQKMLEKPIFAALDKYSMSEGIKKILDISFADLSLPVKSCLLYLSAFPKDYIIKKDHLIRIWVAEGYIPKRDEESLWETGESYFNELIGRRLIQPVFLDDGYEYDGGYDDDQPFGCTVHDAILDFIVSLSSKENFVTPVAEFRSMSFPRDVIRRLSLNNTNHEDDTLIPFKKEDENLTSSTMSLSKVRLLSCFGDAKGMPDLSKFRFLRVLDLNNTMNLKSDHLESIGRLFLLRYLGLRGSGVTVLPEEIGQLQHMEILDLRRNSLGQLPASIVGLRKLVCLLLGYCERLPRGVENMPDLEELTIQVDRPVLLHDVAEIVKSKRLRRLGVRWGEDSYDQRSVMSFLNEVGKSSLQSLLLQGYPAGDLLHLLLDSWIPPHQLRRFELTISSSLRGVPPKMASLVDLTHLRIEIGHVEVEDLRVLGDLPNLILLDLHSEYSGFERLIISKDGFRRLVVFSYTCGLGAGMGLQFTPGAMQQLRRLRFEFNARETGSQYEDFDFGIQHLSCLTRVHATIHCRGAKDLKLEDSAEAAIREQVSKNPNSPVLELSRQIDDRRMARQEEHENVQESYKAQEKNLEQKSVISDKDSDEEHETLQKQHDIMELEVDSDTNKQADSRAISMLSEPPPHLVNPGGEVIQILNLVGSALGKICGMIAEDRRPKGKLKKGLESIMREIRMTIADIKEEENSQGATQTMRFLELQELAYDIEDFIDGLWEPGACGPILTAIGLDPRPQDLDRIDHFKDSIQRVRKWQPSASPPYNTPAEFEGIAKSKDELVGIAKPKDELVGIAEAKDELLELLSVADGQPRQLRVISIVGCRGLGKTALARAVYDDTRVADAFPCRAWVVASECNDAEILVEVRPAAAGETTSHVKQPITELHDILKDNRYLVVVDDVQRAEVWKEIEHAFPKNGNSSRIIVTTSLRSVANACSSGNYVYTMQYLDQAKSKRLLWRKFYSPEEVPPSLVDGSKSILDKCDGLPLALISVANYLGGKGPQLTRDYCEKVGQELGYYLAAGKESSFGEMKRALMECFDSLPDHQHRSCLLYVSFFPRGHRINRESLIRRWIAEGLNEEKFARDCFDELIDRSIIEPVLVCNGSNKVVERYQVHSVMMEFIIHKSVSNNFISLIHKDEAQRNKDTICRVRRLSVQYSSNEGGGGVAKKIGLCSIRSLTICSSYIFDFKDCKLLRVLDLEDCKGLTESVLDVICKLRFLKYLSLRGSDVSRIPERMGKLYDLETLDIRETEVEILPVEVIMLPRLAHLFGRFELSRVSEEISDKVKKGSLQTLAGVVIDKEYTGFEQIMLHARKLSKVKIWYNATPRGNNSTHPNKKAKCINSTVSSLLSSLQKRFIGSKALDTLSIDSSDLSKEFVRSLVATCDIRTIKLRGKLERLPDSNTLRQLRNLNKLHLFSTGLSSEVLSELQTLRCLEYLKLAEDRDGFSGSSFVVQRDGFPSLHRLCFEAPKLPLLMIEQGAMTKLTSLQMLCQEFADGLGVTGIEHLQRLDEVILHSSASDAVMEAWKRAAIQHQNRPYVKKQQINDAA